MSFCTFREIIFGESGSARTAILTYLEVLHLDFYVFLQFLKAEIDQINKIQSPKIGKKPQF